MSFIDKYNINKEWAKSAYTDKKYDIAINRMYYSLYQKVLHNLSKESISLLNKKKGSHVDTIKLYTKSFHTDDEFFDKTKFTNQFIKLKKFRVQADYTEKFITEDEINKLNEIYNNLDNIIKK